MVETVLQGQAADALPGAPLLTTKLYIPHGRPNLVPRPRLSERLDETLRCKLAVVSAPAGFGKTTLLGEWAQGLAGRASAPAVGWLSLDEGDNDPIRFWGYTIAALQSAQPEIGQVAWSQLHAPQPPPIKAILATLINEVAAMPGALVLILDDYHLVEAETIHGAAAYLLDHLPPQMHLVIAGRTELSLSLARLRAQGQLVELRTEDLRFTPEEASAFLSRVLGPGLSPENIATLAARTEGWAAGLQLAALSLQDRTDVDRFVQTFAGDDRYILEYLLEEVLQRQSERVQTFLLQTSILDRLCSPLCDAVTAENGSQAMLEHLDAANLFTLALDSRKRWYRYHQLFRDLLRHRLRETMPERIRALHRRACAWHEQNGSVHVAISHALEAQDWEHAGDLMEGVWESGLAYSESAGARRRLEALPDELLRRRPLLSIAYAWTLLAGEEPRRVEPYLQSAEAGLQMVPDRDEAWRRRWLGHVDALRATVLHNAGDAMSAAGLAQRALERLPERDLHTRSLATLTLGYAYGFGARIDVAQATRAFTDAIATSRAAGDTGLALLAMYSLSSLQMRQGALHQAAETFQRALALAPEPDAYPLPSLARLHMSYGELLRERNDLSTAAEQIEEGIRLCKQAGRLVDLVDGYIYLSRLRQAEGNWRDALEAIQKARMLAEGALQPYGHSQDGPVQALDWLVHMVYENQAWLWLSQGNVAAAARWAQERGLQPHEVGAGRSNEYATFARLLTMQGQAQEALTILDRLLEIAKPAGEVWNTIHLRGLQALAFAALGDIGKALDSLRSALTIAEPEGFVRIFADKGAALAELLAEVGNRELKELRGLKGDSEAGELVSYIESLLSVMGKDDLLQVTPSDPSGPSVPSSSSSSLLEPLTDRELEVLGLMAEGLSNQEIADRLIVAIGTVKKHTHNIYGKLGVRSRTQAMLAAQELGLLEP